MKAILIDTKKQEVKVLELRGLESIERILKCIRISPCFELENGDAIIVNDEPMEYRGLNGGGFYLPEIGISVIGSALVVSSCGKDCESIVNDFDEVIFLGEEEAISQQHHILNVFYNHV